MPSPFSFHKLRHHTSIVQTAGAVSVRLDCTAQLHFADRTHTLYRSDYLIFVVSAPLTMNKTHDLLLTCSDGLSSIVCPSPRHNDDRPSKFTVLANNMKSAIKM